MRKRTTITPAECGAICFKSDPVVSNGHKGVFRKSAAKEHGMGQATAWACVRTVTADAEWARFLSILFSGGNDCSVDNKNECHSSEEQMQDGRDCRVGGTQPKTARIAWKTAKNANGFESKKRGLVWTENQIGSLHSSRPSR